MSCNPRFRITETACTVLGIVLLSVTAGVAQSPPTPSGAQDAALLDTVRELQQEVRALRGSVDELRVEAAQYRAETQQLREEINRGRAASAGQPGPAASPAAVPAQESAGSQESNVARLARTEEDLQLLTAKVNDQYQSKVESGSKYRVRLYGIALFNLYGNRGNVDSVDNPDRATDGTALSSEGSFGGTLRQSILGLETFGPQLAGAQTRADLQFDFAGGFPNVQNGVTYGLARLRTATMQLNWTNTSIIGGQDTLFFAPLAPASYASLDVPALAYAGNLWGWIPQLRVEHRHALSGESELMFKAGILDSLTAETPYGQYELQPGAGERSGQPAYATHVGYQRGPSEHAFRFGAGAYYNRQNWGFARKVDGWAALADWTVPMSRWFALSGEFYRGRAVGGLGGGVGQTVLLSGPLTVPTTTVEGLNSAGGWAQLKFMPAAKLEFNTALGQDNPYAADFRGVSSSQPYLTERNRGFLTNMILHPRSDLVLSLEYRHLRTMDALGAPDSANHFNAALGVLF
jgi:hypothetical protein